MPWYAVRSAVTFSRKWILAEPNGSLSTIATEVSSLEAGINVHSGFGVGGPTYHDDSIASVKRPRRSEGTLCRDPPQRILRPTAEAGRRCNMSSTEVALKLLTADPRRTQPEVGCKFRRDAPNPTSVARFGLHTSQRTTSTGRPTSNSKINVTNIPLLLLPVHYFLHKGFHRCPHPRPTLSVSCNFLFFPQVNIPLCP